MIKKCKRCLYDSQHPFGLTFNSKGVCSGCLIHEEKYKINWENKKDDLHIFFQKIRKKKRSYDCIVPVFGDAEDYYVIEKVLSFNLNPLIVHINNYFYNDIGWYNFQNLITHFDLDSHTLNPKIETYKNLVRKSLRKYNNIMWPYNCLLKSYPVEAAIQKN